MSSGAERSIKIKVSITRMLNPTCVAGFGQSGQLVTGSHLGLCVGYMVVTEDQSISQSIGICIAPPTNSGRRYLTI